MTFEYDNNLILVDIDEENKVAVITMNNPPLNTNTIASIEELREAFRKTGQDERVNAIVLTGSGEKAFNVGTDLSHFMDFRGNYVGKKFRLESDVMNDIELCEKPVIAAIEGYMMGGGLEIALCCDFRFISEKTIVSAPEVDLGVYCSSGGVVRLPKTVGYEKALEMLLFCERYDAQQCLDMGLCSKVFPAGTVKEEAIKAARILAHKPPKAVRTTKRACREFLHKDSTDCFHKNLDMVEEVYNDVNAVEGVSAFLQKRKPNFVV